MRREVDVDASPEEVFEALVTEEGRERWLEEPDRQIHIESADPPNRLVWWWSSDEQPATRVDFRIVELPRGTRVVVTESVPRLPARRDGRKLRAGGRLSDQLGAVFSALADPTRRGMVETLLRDGSTSVPALSAELPISRQAVAKHLAALEDAGLLERLPGGGREVRYGLRGEALGAGRVLAARCRDRRGSGASGG